MYITINWHLLRQLVLKLKQSHDPPLLIVFCIKAKPTGYVLLETHWCVCVWNYIIIILNYVFIINWSITRAGSLMP